VGEQKPTLPVPLRCCVQVMYWTPTIPGVLEPFRLVLTSTHRLSFVLLAVLLFPGFRNACPDWMYLVGDDDRWHPLLFLVQRGLEEAAGLLLLTTLGSFEPPGSGCGTDSGNGVLLTPLLDTSGQVAGLDTAFVRGWRGVLRPRCCDYGCWRCLAELVCAALWFLTHVCSCFLLALFCVVGVMWRWWRRWRWWCCVTR